MMAPMTVVDMHEERRKRDLRRREGGEDGYDGLVCGCGEAWFALHGRGSAVCLGPDGEITGYSGTLKCVSCGKRL